jgi:acyl-coenzyme A synthetase/AMP-(fatty) acid ligase
MKRAVLCVPNPHDYIDQLDAYSIMIINPTAPDSRKQYLLGRSDWSLKITDAGQEYRAGGDYADERLFWYTSGTTGDSKFYSFTQHQLDVMAKTIVTTYDLTSNDRYVGIMPLWHAHGQGFYWATKLAKCETTFLSISEIKRMPDHAPTFITAVPDVLRVLANFKFQDLRFIRSASAPLPDQLYLHLKKFAVPVIEALGMTEALSHCFTNPLHGEQRMGTVGLPDGIEARTQDGHLLIRGPTVFESGWYDTGDLAEQDSAGYYKILGRSTEQINVKGYKINPLSIEQQLKILVDNLGDCVIFGNNAVKVLYTGSAQKETIIKNLKLIHPACKPVFIQYCEQIPVGPSGKISRSWLNCTFK